MEYTQTKVKYSIDPATLFRVLINKNSDPELPAFVAFEGDGMMCYVKSFEVVHNCDLVLAEEFVPIVRRA